MWFESNWASHAHLCLFRFCLELDHGQTLLFGPSGTDLRLRRWGQFGPFSRAAVRCERSHGGAIVSKASWKRHGRALAARPPCSPVRKTRSAQKFSAGDSICWTGHHAQGIRRCYCRDTWRGGCSSLRGTARSNELDCHITKGLIAAERNRFALHQARRDWIMHRQPRMRAEPHRLVFVDETAAR